MSFQNMYVVILHLRSQQEFFKLVMSVHWSFDSQVLSNALYNSDTFFMIYTCTWTAVCLSEDFG